MSKRGSSLHTIDTGCSHPGRKFAPFWGGKADGIALYTVVNDTNQAMSAAYSAGITASASISIRYSGWTNSLTPTNVLAG